MSRRILLLFACLLTTSLPVAGKTPPADPWKTALAFDYNTAAERLAELHDASPADARIAIAYASSLLVRQPRTEANIRAARDLLQHVHSVAPAGDYTPVALYLLARVELDHLAQSQPDSARARLEQLRRDHPAHPLADHAALELAHLLIHPPEGRNLAAIPDVERMLASVTAPQAARDLHQLLGTLKLRHLDQPSAALAHFTAARAVGFEQPLRDAEADLTIANLARETGDPALARRHYAAFLTAAPRDVRADTVRNLLANLSANSTAPAIR